MPHSHAFYFFYYSLNVLVKPVLVLVLVLVQCCNFFFFLRICKGAKCQYSFLVSFSSILLNRSVQISGQSDIISHCSFNLFHNWFFLIAKDVKVLFCSFIYLPTCPRSLGAVKFSAWILKEVTKCALQHTFSLLSPPSLLSPVYSLSSLISVYSTITQIPLR